jgi:hypothetical protein
VALLGVDVEVSSKIGSFSSSERLWKFWTCLPLGP